MIVPPPSVTYILFGTVSGLPVPPPVAIVIVVPMRLAVIGIGERRRDHTGREGGEGKHGDN